MKNLLSSIRKLFRKTIKFALFVMAASSPVKTAYEYLAAGHLKSYGLTTSLSLYSVLLNLGLLACTFIFEFGIIYGIGLLTFFGLWMFTAILAILGVGVRILYFVAVHRPDKAVSLIDRFNEVFSGRILDEFGSIAMVDVAVVSTVLSLLAFSRNAINPLHSMLRQGHDDPSQKFMSYMGLAALAFTYAKCYRWISRYLKSVESDPEGTETTTAR